MTKTLLAAAVISSCAHVPAPTPTNETCIKFGVEGAGPAPEQVYACALFPDGVFTCVTMQEFLEAVDRARASTGEEL